MCVCVCVLVRAKQSALSLSRCNDPDNVKLDEGGNRLSNESHHVAKITTRENISTSFLSLSFFLLLLFWDIGQRWVVKWRLQQQHLNFNVQLGAKLINLPRSQVKLNTPIPIRQLKLSYMLDKFTTQSGSKVEVKLYNSYITELVGLHYKNS